MSGFENFTQQVEAVEREIIRKAIALGIDWDDPLEVQALAREALAWRQGFTRPQAIEAIIHAVGMIENPSYRHIHN